MSAEQASFLLSLAGHHLWFGLALVAAVGLALRLTRGLNAGTRYWIWGVTLLALLIFPLAAFVPTPELPEVDVTAAPERSSRAVIDLVSAPTEEDESVVAVAPSTTTKPESTSPPRRDWAPAALWPLAAFWLTGVAWSLVGIGRGLLRARGLRRRARPAQGRVAVAYRFIDPKPRAALLESDEVASPMVVGPLRPAILVPSGVEESLDDNELAQVLTHEAVHVRRRDGIVVFAERVIEALFFYHPAVRWAARQLDEERERSCDDATFQTLGSVRDYAACLLKVGRKAAAPSSPVLAVGVFRSTGQLSRRIRYMLDKNRNHRARVSRPTLWLFATAAAVIFLGVAVAMPEPPKAPAPPAPPAAEMPATTVAPPAPPTAAEPGPEPAPAPPAPEPKPNASPSPAPEPVPEPDRAVVNKKLAAAGTPLIRAARRGDADEVLRLLDEGADANEAISGPEPRSPLVAAARAGHADVVRILLDHGADPNRIVRGDETPLIAAARAGSVETARLLLERGADANRTVPGDGSPMIAAAGTGNAELVGLLLDHGADPSEAVAGDGSPLIAAANEGNEPIVAMLIDAGAVDVPVPGDGSAMIAAAASGNVGAVQALLDRGADPDGAVRGDGTPLIAAARNGHHAVAQLLLDRGADPDAAVRGDGSPLIAASRHGQVAIARLLLDRGADADSEVRGDGSPLIAAAQGGHAGIAQMLLDGGARVDKVVPGDETALINAAAHGHLDVAKLLLKRGADPNLSVLVFRQDGGTETRSPLSEATRNGHDEMVRLLRSYGARE